MPELADDIKIKLGHLSKGYSRIIEPSPVLGRVLYSSWKNHCHRHFRFIRIAI